jgi:hypothetical protein
MFRPVVTSMTRCTDKIVHSLVQDRHIAAWRYSSPGCSVPFLAEALLFGLSYTHILARFAPKTWLEKRRDQRRFTHSKKEFHLPEGSFRLDRPRGRTADLSRSMNVKRML